MHRDNCQILGEVVSLLSLGMSVIVWMDLNVPVSHVAAETGYYNQDSRIVGGLQE
jgi:hypothetical protein